MRTDQVIPSKQPHNLRRLGVHAHHHTPAAPYGRNGLWSDVPIKFCSRILSRNHAALGPTQPHLSLTSRLSPGHADDSCSISTCGDGGLCMQAGGLGNAEESIGY